MLNRKRWLALGMVMTLAAAGCGGNGTSGDPTPTPTKEATPVPTTPAPTPTTAPDPTPTTAPDPTTAPTPTEAPSYEAGKVIDFEDGNMGFIACKETAPNSAALDMGIVDFGGSKALKVATADTGKIPYVAIDISSLAGDAVESVRSIEMDIGVTAEDGNFYAVSGNVYYYVGAENTEASAKWSVYLAVKNPKRAVVTLADDEAFAAGAKNIIILTKEADNAIDKIDSASTFYIDNIVLKDADGNAIALNAAASFDAPEGFANVDWSNMTPTKPELKLDGMKYESTAGWWPNGADGNQHGVTIDPVVAADQATVSLFDAAAFTSGKFLTATVSLPDGIEDWQKQVQFLARYEAKEGSELTMPAWEIGTSEDGLAEVVGGETDRTFSLKMHMNDSLSMAQISYDEVAAYLNDPDWINHVSFMGIRDAGYVLTVSEAYIGTEKKILPATINDVVLNEFTGLKGAAFSQVGSNTIAWEGTLDPAVFKPGCVITVNYKSEGTVWPVVQSADSTYGWSRLAYDEPGEIKSKGLTNDDNDTVQFTYEQLLADLQLLGEKNGFTVTDLSGLGCLQFESDQEFEILCVSVGEYAPEALKFTDEVILEGSACSGAGWAQAGVNTTVNGGTFDAVAMLVPGTVINFYYKDNGANYWAVCDGTPFGWTRVGDGSEGSKGIVARMDPTKKIMQITYDQLVEVLGTEDFSGLNVLQAESSAEWEVYQIGVAKLAE